MSSHPKVLVFAPTDFGWRDLRESGTADLLAARFELSFLTGSKLTTDLSQWGAATAFPVDPRWRQLAYAVGKGLIHARARRRRLGARPQHALYRAVIGQPRRVRAVIRVLHGAGLSRPAGAILLRILRATAPPLPIAGHDAVFMPSGVESSLGDDIVRVARTAGVPVLAVQANWDNIGTKTYVELPEHHAVWGEQSALIARLLHRVPSHRIWVTGTPRLDLYRDAPTRAVARARLGIEPDATVLVVCGSGMPFDEVSVLDTLADAIEGGDLPADLRLLYKPHPFRQGRIDERPFRARPPVLCIAPQRDDGLSSLASQTDLLAACDALITPFSTMAIEGALLGRPTLGLGYDDPGHANYDWNRAIHELHLSPLLRASWCVPCLRRDDLVDCTRRLLSMIGDDAVADAARVTGGWVARSDGRAAERLVDALADVVAGRPADGSVGASVGSDFGLVATDKDD